jgi:hypothetical protein
MMKTRSKPSIAGPRPATRQQPRIENHLDAMMLHPHPVIAPIAWISCFLFGAGLWVYVLGRIF